ncbi:MAG TPA: hypothetical protein VK956_11570 [Verrucomicrobium sp.]|nr:hypothetical protein [Verrucomicrobium sp.]
MHALHRPVSLPWNILRGVVLVALGAIAYAQQPAAALPDPLQFLAAGEKVRDGEMRLSLGLLRIPAADMAKALTLDEGQGKMSWGKWLESAKAQGILDFVTGLANEASPRESFKMGFQRTLNYVPQGESSHYWSTIQRWPGRGLPPGVWAQMLEGLAHEPVGTVATGQMDLETKHGGAEIALEFTHTHGVTERPNATWAHDYFPTPRKMFRPWTVRTQALVPLHEPFLVATQMEPPDDGQGHTGYVLALFGQVTVAPDLARREMEVPRLKSTGGAAQAWTLTVPAKAFTEWIAKRQSPAEDGPLLHRWLASPNLDGGGKAELRMVTSLATSPGKTSLPVSEREQSVKSQLRWNDSSGFEPPGTDKVFRPLVAEEEVYSVQYNMAVDLTADASEPGAAASRVEGILTLDSPAGPVRWKHWKHAMEGTEADPGNLELAEVNLHNREAINLETSGTWQPGKILLTSAALQGDRALVTFTRMIDGTSQPKAPPAFPGRPAIDLETSASLGTTVWRIDTPLDWMPRLLQAGPSQTAPLGKALLKAVSEGKATVSSVTHNAHRSGQSARWQAAEPVTYYGGNYVNTAPHPKGIYFNMRHLELKMVGENDRTGATFHRDSGLIAVHVGAEHSRLPTWQHWGIWQPGVPETHATNSGITRPSFPAGELRSSARVPLGEPCVVSVIQADSGAATSPPKVLRWCVTQVTWQEPKPTPAPPSAAKEELEPLFPLQCLVVAVEKSLAIPAQEQSQELALSLVTECLAGQRTVLDAACLQYVPPRDFHASIASGTEYHFTNGRPHRRNGSEDDIIRATATMPPDTSFESQIDFSNRLVGLRFEVGYRRWKLTRDMAAPQVVTDTFNNAMYEFPMSLAQTAARTTVSVQRPIFNVAEAEGLVPPVGEASVTRLTEDSAVIIRWMK